MVPTKLSEYSQLNQSPSNPFLLRWSIPSQSRLSISQSLLRPPMVVLPSQLQHFPLLTNPLPTFPQHFNLAQSWSTNPRPTGLLQAHIQVPVILIKNSLQCSIWPKINLVDWSINPNINLTNTNSSIQNPFFLIETILQTPSNSYIQSFRPISIPSVIFHWLEYLQGNNRSNSMLIDELYRNFAF